MYYGIQYIHCLVYITYTVVYVPLNYLCTLYTAHCAVHIHYNKIYQICIK